MATPTQTGTTVPAGGKAGGAFPPFQGDTFASQILWLAISFGLLYLLLSRVALPRIAGILEERSDRISQDLAEAQRLKSESEAANAAYEKSLADARARAQAIAGETRAKVAAESDANRKQIEADLSAKLQAAEATIVAAKAEALGNVRAIALEATPAIVQKLSGVAPSADDVARAVDLVLKR